MVSHLRLQEQPSNLSANLVTASGTQNPPRSSTQSQQESVLQKFRKSFSLRFHKKGSKESNESECPAEDNDGSGPLDEEEEREQPTVTEQTPQHKEDTNNDQKFRLVRLSFLNCELLCIYQKFEDTKIYKTSKVKLSF